MSNSGVEIITYCRQCLDEFEKVIAQSSPFEVKGILNSEMLLAASLLKYNKANLVIESGRARAQSTEIMARWINTVQPNTRFVSIEYDPKHPDVPIAAERMAKINQPVELVFGDSRLLVKDLIEADNVNTLMIIDGPKGIDALLLAMNSFKRKAVKCILIHDLHADEKFLRWLIKMIWSQPFFSDDRDFVALFSHLDKQCWVEHQKHDQFKDWGPYKRGNRLMKSYGPTFACVFNEFTGWRWLWRYYTLKVLRNVIFSVKKLKSRSFRNE